jgi:hypothetical protein
MSQHDGTNITTLSASSDTDTRRPQRRADVTTTDRAARREDRRKRNIRRRAVETNELRFALHEAGTLRHFERAAA